MGEGMTGETNGAPLRCSPVDPLRSRRFQVVAHSLRSLHNHHLRVLCDAV